MAANELNETTILDDEELNLGTSKDLKLVFDSGDNRVEFRDTSDTLRGHITGAGVFTWLGAMSAASLSTTDGISTTGKLNIGANSTLTIASGAITVTKSYHRVSGEGAANDDLTTINGGAEGDILVLRRNTQTITVKDATGNILLTGGDCVLNASGFVLVLLNYDGSNWMELCRQTS